MLAIVEMDQSEGGGGAVQEVPPEESYTPAGQTQHGAIAPPVLRLQ